jgi:two-component system sensor histidine kinase/response regulator
LLNLLSNAIKFTASGGQVTLRLWQENNGAVFQIEDTGIGIADHQFPLLFKKFQQLDMSYQRGYEGSGLGLAITKQLVDLHGGWIEVDSMVNVGSTFTVWIPDKLPDDGREKQRDRDTNSIPPERNGRIVLIEDDEDTASLICDLLTAAGYQVIWMLKGATITQQIEILQPLILLINIYLPWINGYEVLQNLRQNQLTANLRILALTPQQLPNHGTYWLQLGVDDSITLPIAQPEQLLDKVARLVQADGVAELQQNS